MQFLLSSAPLGPQVIPASFDHFLHNLILKPAPLLPHRPAAALSLAREPLTHRAALCADKPTHCRMEVSFPGAHTPSEYNVPEDRHHRENCCSRSLGASCHPGLDDRSGHQLHMIWFESVLFHLFICDMAMAILPEDSDDKSRVQSPSVCSFLSESSNAAESPVTVYGHLLTSLLLNSFLRLSYRRAS